jgi:SPX domain protein involved in polyphosphate accumulation
MSRIEYKYRLNKKQLDNLKADLAPHVIHDDYSGKMPEKKYTVKSIYLDTSALDFYQEKLSGIKRRKKVRIRGYNQASEDAIIFLEVKRKNGPTINKSRAAVKHKNLPDLMSEGDIKKYVFGTQQGSQQYRSANYFFYYVQKLSLIPAIKVMYEREAFYYKFNEKLRITIDTNLRSSLNVSFKKLHNEENVMYAMPGSAILEIKFETEIPVWLQNILTKYNLSSQALSKYTHSLESHSKYERQLQRSLHGLAKYNEFKYYPRKERNI